jgi:hypothetical protein
MAGWRVLLVYYMDMALVVAGLRRSDTSVGIVQLLESRPHSFFWQKISNTQMVANANQTPRSTSSQHSFGIDLPSAKVAGKWFLQALPKSGSKSCSFVYHSFSSCANVSSYIGQVEKYFHYLFIHTRFSSPIRF